MENDTRTRAMAMVDAERDRQEARLGKQSHAPERWATFLMAKVGEFSLAVNEMIFDNGFEPWVKGDVENMVKALVQIAAVAVAAIEHFLEGTEVERLRQTTAHLEAIRARVEAVNRAETGAVGILRTHALEDVPWMLNQIDSLKSFCDRIARLPDCNDCGKRKDCQHRPGWGAATRINCPLWDGREFSGRVYDEQA